MNNVGKNVKRSFCTNRKMRTQHDYGAWSSNLFSIEPNKIEDGCEQMTDVYSRNSPTETSVMIHYTKVRSSSNVDYAHQNFDIILNRVRTQLLLNHTKDT